MIIIADEPQSSMPPLLEYENPSLSTSDTDEHEAVKAAATNEEGILKKEVECDTESTLSSEESSSSLSEEEEELLPSPLTSTSSKSVRFVDDVRVREIPKLSKEEVVDCWMNQQDYKNIKQECITVVRMAMVAAKPIPSPTVGVGVIGLPVDLRGLESKTPTGIHRRVQNKTGAIQAVLNEQKLQKHRGIKDPDWIASVYKEVTRRCSMEAKIMGMRDEIAITKDIVFFSQHHHGLAAMKYYASRLEI